MKRLLKSILNPTLPYLAFVIYRILQWTWKVEIVESPDVKRLMAQGDQPFVIAHWHGDELGIVQLAKKYQVACIVSTSHDGQIMSRVIHLLGGVTTRGSSTRKGIQALKGIIRLVKHNRRPVLAVDGPKGPIYKVKPGVFQVAKLAKIPIIPISFYADRAYCFEKAWNKSKLPKPWSRVTIQWGEIFSFDPEEDLRSVHLADRLASEIQKTKEKAKSWALKNEI